MPTPCLLSSRPDLGSAETSFSQEYSAKDVVFQTPGPDRVRDVVIFLSFYV